MDDYRLTRLLQGNPITQTGRKRDPNRNRGYKKTKWQQRNIVAWDGEGANLEGGEHVYNLLANSFGHYIINHDGLSTEECLRFFLRDSKRSAINVIYGGSYDVNMFLRDLPVDKITTLWSDGTVYWKNYQISYAHRKRFSIKLYNYEMGKRPIREFILWDVLGYFQKSFVEACRAWFGNELTQYMPVLDQIDAMKQQRSSFSVEKIEEIVAYNHAECKLLVLLIQQLFNAMDEAGIQLIRYDGAGSIAASLMRRNNILEHGGSNEVNDAYYWAQYAYSGGRIEACQVGNCESGTIRRNDINSAYPSSCLELPSLAGAYWRANDEWDGHAYSMAEVEWHYREEAPFYPLWYRCPDGTIIYPREGRGRYWGSELSLLREFYVEGIDYDIIQAMNCELALDYKPFQFLRHDYATRRMFKDKGSMASEALKLGMNSVYGKLAQQAGFRNGRIPTYHNLYWAGQITSATRAHMFRAARQHPNAVIAFATDAIISTSDFDLPSGTGLGEWTPEQFDGATVVQAGVYWLLHNGEWTSKYRGFDKGSIEREKILDCWHSGEVYEAWLTRFYGMGSAVGLNNFTDYWRVWRTEPRKLDIIPKGKRVPTKDRDYADRLCRTDAAHNPFAESLSTPYPIAWGLLGGVNLRLIAEQDGEVDVRIAEEEYLDSYA